MAKKGKETLIIYESDDGKVRLDVQFDEDTVWLKQDQIATLFQTDRSNVSKHIKNIYLEGELKAEQTCAKIAQIVENRKRYEVKHYNLDIIISVGYRVNSVVATRFRQWATQTLREFIIKGFVMDDITFGITSFNPKPKTYKLGTC